MSETCEKTTSDEEGALVKCQLVSGHGGFHFYSWTLEEERKQIRHEIIWIEAAQKPDSTQDK